MTEYTTSSHAFREYMSTRDRTARWVQTHSPTESEFYSPSLPPTVIDGFVPSSPPSEADSSHSTPPKMVLRYNDGRPDIPIPHPGHGPSLMGKSGSKIYQTSAPQTSSGVRSDSSAESPVYNPSNPRRGHESRLPEEIRILPSSGEVPMSSRFSGHTRSKSLPRSSLRQRPLAPEVPFIPPSHLQTQSPYLGQGPSAIPPEEISPPPQQVNFAPPTHPWPPRHGHPKHTPPAIVYAPHHSHQPHYAPPAMFHHPPQLGPNGMIYSHSAPVPGQYRPAYPTPYPSVLGTSSRHHSSSAHAHTRSLGQSTRINPTSSSASLTSQNSGSTYYVLPAHGQKVHVINASPEQSIFTATSTTKSPTTPTFGKKPFLQRLFGFARFSNAGSARGSSNDGRKLQRRHSLGPSRNEQSQ